MELQLTRCSKFITYYTMPGGNKNIKGSDNTAGFQVNPQNINKKGGPLSIRNQIREILAMDGRMKIKKEHVMAINEDGSVEILMPKRDMVAMKLLQWAMSNKETASVRSIQIIMDHLEGKPHQSVDVSLGNINIDPKQWIDETE